MDQTITAEVRPTIRVILEGAGASWSAFAPSVPGCIATGHSQEEVRRNLESALEVHLRELHDIELAEIEAELKAESPA